MVLRGLTTPPFQRSVWGGRFLSKFRIGGALHDRKLQWSGLAAEGKASAKSLRCIGYGEEEVELTYVEQYKKQKQGGGGGGAPKASQMLQIGRRKNKKKARRCWPGKGLV